MYMVATARAKRFLCGALIVCALACLLLLGLLLLRKGGKTLPVFNGQVNIYQTRSELLMEAMRSGGACTPEDAAKTWAEGLRLRSAALQYAAMNDMLKEEYAKRLESTAPNWVTGMSSPWVESYTLVKLNEGNANSKTAELTFTLATSTGPAGEYSASLLLAVENGFWRVAGISMDEALYPYTGF